MLRESHRIAAALLLTGGGAVALVLSTRVPAPSYDAYSAALLAALYDTVEVVDLALLDATVSNHPEPTSVLGATRTVRKLPARIESFQPPQTLSRTHAGVVHATHALRAELPPPPQPASLVSLLRVRERLRALIAVVRLRVSLEGSVASRITHSDGGADADYGRLFT